MTVGPAAVSPFTPFLVQAREVSREEKGGDWLCGWPGRLRTWWDSLRLYCFSLSRQLLTHRRNICLKRQVSGSACGRGRTKCLCQTAQNTAWPGIVLPSNAGLEVEAGLYPFMSNFIHSYPRSSCVLCWLRCQGHVVPKYPKNPDGPSGRSHRASSPCSWSDPAGTES